MATKHSNLLVEDSIKAVKERLKNNSRKYQVSRWSSILG